MPFHIPARPQAAVQVAAWDALPQWGHRLKQIQAHSGLLSGSEHIHKDTHVGEEPSILPTATAIASPAGWPVLHTRRQILSLSSYAHSVFFRKTPCLS